MKKVLCVLVGILMMFSLVACNKDKTPDDFVVFDMQLGGLTNEELKTALVEAVDNYVINATLEEDTFPITGEVIGMKFNEELDLSDAANQIDSGDLTAKYIEENLFTLGSDTEIKYGIINSYRAYLETMIASSDAAKMAAEDEDTSAVEVSEANFKDSVGAKVISPEGIVNELTNEESVEVKILSEEEITAINEKIKSLSDVTSAKIEYSESEGKFVGVDGVAGETRDYTKAIATLKEDVSMMKKDTSLVTEMGQGEGQKFADSLEAQAALEEANKYFDITVTYSFDVPGGSSGTETIDKSNIKNYIFVDTDGLSIAIDKEALALYASNLSTKYSNIKEKSENNANHTVTVTRTGWETNSNTIYDNIFACLDEVKSGSFTAEYKEVNESRTTDHGTVYVYVDLSAQTVTLYKNDEAIASAPCVSGCVAKGHATPNGTYHIYYKQKNTYLVGADYRCFVNFWMPFNGGIGLHDASWKSTFGGTEYFYDGSHGCINLPYSIAKTIYDNVSAGTTVIVRGGVYSLDLATQSFSGTKEYTFNIGDATTLNISADGGDPKLSYASNDSSIVTVDEDGNIKAVGAGNATITVHADRTSDGKYDSGDCYVYIHVLAPETKPTEPSTEAPTQSTETSTSESESTTVSPTSES